MPKWGARPGKPAVAPGQGEEAELLQASPEHKTAGRLFGRPDVMSGFWGKGQPYDSAFRGVTWVYFFTGGLA
jgi:hypothetical protein